MMVNIPLLKVTTILQLSLIAMLLHSPFQWALGWIWPYFFIGT
jgi:hypothetical protein